LDYEQRFSSLKNLYDDLLSNIIRMRFDPKEAYDTATQFFGEKSVRFAGIDGTMYSRPLFDLVIFFGGAYASTGTITFYERSKPMVTYDEKTLERAAGISSVVPVYINEIPDIDQTFFEAAQPEEISLGMPLTDQSIIDNSTIANWIMTFAEFYLAYRLAADPSQGFRIILMDRSLSIGRASLIYDTAKRDLWKTKSSLIGCRTDDDEPFDMNDFTIARQCLCDKALGLPPPRGDYLSHAIVEAVKQRETSAEEQILADLAVRDEKRTRRVERYLNRLVREGVLAYGAEAYSLNPKYRTTLERIKKLVASVGDRFFFAETPETGGAQAMKIMKDGNEHWLTTVDIAFLTLFALQMLIEECWKKHILLLGMTKDTAARDFKRQLVPIMHNEGMLKTAIPSAEFEKLPNTDRMILQSASISSTEKIKPPWALIEHDSAFRTIVPDRQKRRGYVSGAIKNRIGLERTFLKSYTQLSQAKSDPKLRSNVLLIDRLAYPEYDYKPQNVAEFRNEFGGAEEPVQVLLYKDKEVQNRLQTLVMTILISMAPSNIPEAFGHNKPLFIADKIAKWNYGQFKCIVDTTASWIVNNHKLRQFIFYMSTFRERRAAIEATRREQV
jgi:hypothetical protein